MHALTLARQRLRARLQSPSTPQPVRLAHGLVEDGRTRVLPVLSSALAQDILTRGYDAVTLDRVYANRPCGDLGLMGKVADRRVLDIPVHQALRERLDAAAGEMTAAVVLALRDGAPECRLLSAGCGLGAELVALAQRLRSRHPKALARLRCWGLDPDMHGELLPEAARRTRAAGLEVRFIREDLRRHRELDAVVEQEGPFHVIACLGTSFNRSLAETRSLVSYYSRHLVPGGTLLIDRWEGGDSCPIASGLGLEVQRPSVRDFRWMLAEASLSVAREHATGEGGCVLVVARKGA